MLNIALREGWIKQNPFNAGETRISLADERPRERILTREEERRLLDACMVTSRAHLRPLLQEGFSGASFVFGGDRESPSAQRSPFLRASGPLSALPRVGSHPISISQ